MWVMPVIEYLGLNPSYIDGTMLGGSSFIAHLLPAMHALQSGQCNAVLVCYGSAQRSGTFSRAEIARVGRQQFAGALEGDALHLRFVGADHRADCLAFGGAAFGRSGHQAIFR